MKLIKPDWPAPRTIHAFTTTRLLGNDPKQYLAGSGLLPATPIWLQQTHGTVALEATSNHQGNEGDAAYAYQSKQICSVLTADCLPLLICDTQASCVAAIHAGWRGLSKGIIESTVHTLPAPPHELMAWLGPAIGPDKFEVGQDVYDAFVNAHAESASAFTPLNEQKWLANLYELARIRLALLGIQQVYGGNFCTYTQADLFFSYRRDKSHTGRMASLIWIS